MNELVKRFTEKYGNIVGEATNGSDVAPIGFIEASQTYIVFYPDAMDRQEYSRGGQVKYRPGYQGPALTFQSQEEIDEEEDAIDRILRASQTLRKRKGREVKAANTRDVKEAVWDRQKEYRNIEIPDFLEEFITRAELAFQEIMSAVQGDFRVFDTAQAAFNGILDCGFFLNVVSDFTEDDVRQLRDLPEKYHLYLGADYVGPQ